MGKRYTTGQNVRTRDGERGIVVDADTKGTASEPNVFVEFAVGKDSDPYPGTVDVVLLPPGDLEAS